MSRPNLRLVERSGPRLPAAQAPELPAAVATDRFPPAAIAESRFGFAHVVAVSLILHGAILVWAADRFLSGDERSAGGTEEAIVIEGGSVQLLDSLPSLPAPPMAEEITSADQAEAVDGTVPVENADPDIQTAEADEPVLPEEPQEAADVSPDVMASASADLAAELSPQPITPSPDDPVEEVTEATPPSAVEDEARPIVEDAMPAEPADRPAAVSVTVAKRVPDTAPAAVEVAEKPAAPSPAKPRKPPARKSAKAASPSAASSGAVAARGPAAAKTGAGGKAKTATGSASAASYQARVRAQLARHRSYPPKAAHRRLSGTATVSFTINASGRVVAARLVRSSGQGVLDRAALAMVRRASPFPAIPPGLGGQITVQAPIRFDVPR